MIIPDYVSKNAKLYPQRTAIKVVGGHSCNFSELNIRTIRLANALRQKGLRKGDRVAVLAENCFEYPEMYFGIGKTGGIIAPLNFRFAGAEISHLVNDAGAKVCIFQEKYNDLVMSIKDELETVQKYICIGQPADGAISYDEILDNAPETDPAIEISMDDLFCLMHTGGTTGTPKLTMLSHRNMVNCALVWVVETGISYGDSFVVNSPLFHTGAAWPLFFTTMLGNTFVILQSFDMEQMAQTIEQDRIACTMLMSQLVPRLLSYSHIADGTYDLSSLKTILVGAAVLPETHLKKLLELFPGIRVTNNGGQTECGIFTGIRLDEHLNKSPEKLSSAGKPAILMDIKIVDENDNEMPPGQVGELCVCGEGVMKGYWNKPEETTWSLRGGWQHTGDLCEVDEDGYLYYVDRLKDMIKSGGENVYSKEVEDILYSHPAVSEVAVIGVPDEKWGEAVKALVVVKEGAKVDSDELIKHCQNHIARFKSPKSVEFIDSLPRTPLGKIDKVKLRDQYRREVNKG